MEGRNMLVVSDSARDTLKDVLGNERAVGKSLVLYLQGAG